MLLAIDSSSGTSVAVLDEDGATLALVTSSDTRRHAEVIGESLASALEQSGVQPAEIRGVAVGMGPGPFTGLRVGIAAARAFALGRAVPVLPVVSHDALAFAAAAGGVSAPLLIVTDARRREVYWSAYEPALPGRIPRRVSGPAIARPDELRSAVEQYDRHHLVDASAADEGTVDAAELGRLALAIEAAGGELAGPEPLYLRSPDVTLSAPKRVAT